MGKGASLDPPGEDNKEKEREREKEMNSGTLAAVLIGAVVGTAMISVAFVYAAKAFSSAQSQVTNWLTGLTWFVCGVCLIVLALMLAFPAG